MPNVVVVVEASEQTILSRRRTRNRAFEVYDPAAICNDISITRDSMCAAEHVQKTVDPGLIIERVCTDDEDIQLHVEHLSTLLEERLRG